MKEKILSIKCLLFLISCFIISGNVIAQSTGKAKITVNGVVTASDEGLPLIGATVVIKGTSIGTATDLDGVFELKANIGDLLQFSYTGMQDYEATVVGESMNIEMNPASTVLEEVVVIGYGTARKKEITGAVSQVKSEDLEKITTSDVASALQGQIAGVNIVSNSGAPGETASIQIRGVTSLNGSNTPLFVVDGIPQDGDPRLSRNEIQTIDVLKDAASASIYGTRGAAGVILITTKRGKAGKTKVSLDALYGTQIINEGTPLMNAVDQLYFESTKEEFVPGAFGPSLNNRPEWFSNDTDLRNFVENDGAITQSYDLGISGGTKEFSYNVVGGYFDQEGILVNSRFKRYNVRANTGYKKGRWNIRSSIAASTENNRRMDGGLLLWSTRYKPYFPNIDITQEVFEISGGPLETQANNVLTRLRRKNTSTRDRINGSLNVGFDITKDLRFNTNLGSGITSVRGFEITPPYSTFDIETGETETDPTKNYIEQNTSRAQTYSLDAGLTYRKKIGLHTFTALASVSVDERTFEYFEAGRQGLANGTVEVLNIGTINPYANSGVDGQQNYVVKTLGTIGRIQYNYNDRYLISASIRRDGSSKFAEANRWGVFPSVSVAWNVSSEPFWEPLQSISDNFKIRASYGSTGNESFPAYQFSSVIDQGADYLFGNLETFGAIQRSFSNGLVKWETSVQTNFGIDLGLWQNKLIFTADFYNTEKQDMLFPIKLPASAGVLSGAASNLTLNVGDMTNKGVELALHYRMKTGKMNWNLSGVFTKNINEITSINGSTEIIYNSNSTSIVGDPNSIVSTLALGHEVGSFFLFKTNGTIKDGEQLATYQEIVPDARLGDLKYEDINKDGKITTLDRVYSGSGLPDYEVGANLTLDFQGLDFTMQWYAAVGHEIINGSAANAYSFERHQGLLNMWTPDNPTSNLPIHRGTSKEQANFAGTTDLWLEDGSYLRLRVATLGYTLPKRMTNSIGMNNFRVYLSAQNPFTFTKYTGFDPEVGGNNVAQRGIDSGRYPISKQYLFGLQFDF